MKIKLYRFLAATVAFLSFTIGQSQNAPTPSVGTDTLAAHYAELTAYLEIAEGAARNSGRAETGNKYKETKDQFMMLSLMLASETRDQEMAVNVTHSRIEVFLKGMMKEIRND